MTRLTIRNCELFVSKGGSTDAIRFPVTVCANNGDVICADVEALTDILWSEPRAAKVFRDHAECHWYVQNFCGDFGKGMARQNTKHATCLAQMYGAVAY